MSRNRISSIPTRLRVSKPQVDCRCPAGFTLVNVGGQGVSAAFQTVYQAAYDEARRDLSQRALLETWNWRNN
ncbi:hypothetical protein [Planctellipticum variicoloris]|uniref:hypothetical protein n=1 Tax=Planctellipticum variicoloris TaxID=3064265 RepID=UPI002B771377|nr:hypothetical protein SH412_002876 [Planctomycetaceae bacterium SH412]HTN01826.1 hypothetical protein [Planctomycetaceae bacterium]